MARPRHPAAPVYMAPLILVMLKSLRMVCGEEHRKFFTARDAATE